MNAGTAITPAQTNFWLLKLVPGVPWGRWLCGLVIFVLILLPYLLLSALSEQVEAADVGLDVALFFAILTAYMVPVHHLIMQRSLSALGSLRPCLTSEPELADHIALRLLHKSGATQLSMLLIGLTAGILHNTLIFSDAELRLTSYGSMLDVCITVLIWIVMTATIWSLVECAVIFRRLTQRVRFDVLETRRLTPFGSVAVSSTLALIGAQAAFPILIIGSQTSWVSFAPGLIATGGPMILIFLLPVIPMHRRIMSAKQAALAQVSKDLEPLLTSEKPDFAALQPLLTYRQEVLSAPEWPFDTSVMGRLAIYLFIPPLTWIGAALIEILVDTAI
jgi:hypothetical protein